MAQERDEKYRRAKARVEALRGFYSHFLTYAAVMVLLFGIDVATGPRWWFYWPLFGWGIGVSLHALNVYGRRGLFGPEWEERKIREIMSKE